MKVYCLSGQLNKENNNMKTITELEQELERIQGAWNGDLPTGYFEGRAIAWEEEIDKLEAEIAALKIKALNESTVKQVKVINLAIAPKHAGHSLDRNEDGQTWCQDHDVNVCSHCFREVDNEELTCELHGQEE